MAYPRTSFDAVHAETRDYSLLAEPVLTTPPGPSRWTLLAAALASRRAALRGVWSARCAQRAGARRATAPLYPRTR